MEKGEHDPAARTAMPAGSERLPSRSREGRNPLSALFEKVSAAGVKPAAYAQ